MDSYAKLLDKLESLNNDLEDAKGEMTASQMNRYLNITQKLSTSISDFQRSLANCAGCLNSLSYNRTPDTSEFSSNVMNTRTC